MCRVNDDRDNCGGGGGGNEDEDDVFHVVDDT